MPWVARSAWAMRPASRLRSASGRPPWPRPTAVSADVREWLEIHDGLKRDPEALRDIVRFLRRYVRDVYAPSRGGIPNEPLDQHPVLGDRLAQAHQALTGSCQCAPGCRRLSCHLVPHSTLLDRYPDES